MRLLLLGAPGSGKGTQATMLAKRLGIEHLSSGDLLRLEIERRTPLGAQVGDLMAAGDLVPDELVIDLMMPYVEAANDRGGWLVDGFPRTLGQAERAYELARARDALLERVVHLVADADQLVDRLLARAHKEGRADDTEATIRHRMEVYTKQTEPLKQFYADRGLLLEVDANGPVEQVNAEIIAGLGAGAA